jgi:hypothetical protein
LSEITLSRDDRLAAIFRKFIDPAIPDPPRFFWQDLDNEFQEVIFRILVEGLDAEKRKKRFLAECMARDWMPLYDRVQLANPNIDLANVAVDDRWKFEKFGDVFQDLPPQEWIVRGILPKPGVGIFFGPPKSLKSLLVMDMALCAASGQRWLAKLDGEGGFETTKTTTLWVDLENGRRRMYERLAALGRARNLGEETPLFFVSLPNPILQAAEKSQIGDLILRVKHFDAGLIVIDHLAATLADVDENASQMAEVMGNYRILSEETGAAVVITHHPVKNINKFGGDLADALRGHGSILANVDTALLVKRDRQMRERIEIIPAALRGADFDDFAATFAYEHKPDNFDLQQARFFLWEQEDLSDLVDDFILEVVGDHPGCNQTELRAFVGELAAETEQIVADGFVRRRLKALIGGGKIILRAGDQRSHLHFLAEEVEDGK